MNLADGERSRNAGTSESLKRKIESYLNPNFFPDAKR